jgi:hypothetical protein
MNQLALMAILRLVNPEEWRSTKSLMLKLSNFKSSIDYAVFMYSSAMLHTISQNGRKFLPGVSIFFRMRGVG